MAQNAPEQLSQARAKVMQASQLLLCPTPHALDHCARLLQAATTGVAACYSELDDGSREPNRDHNNVAAEEARQLQRAVCQARVLLDAALEFHQRWTRRLGAMAGGYTSGGEPATVDHGSRLVLRG